MSDEARLQPCSSRFSRPKPNAPASVLPTSLRYVEAHGVDWKRKRRRISVERFSKSGFLLGPSEGSRDETSVLVIDDEKTFRIVVEEALSADGFDVSSASNGEAGLRAWQREPADFVILDRNLPDTDGVKLLEELVGEARERNVDTLVVMATRTRRGEFRSSIEARRIRLPDQTRPFAGAHRDLSQCARSSAPSKPGSNLAYREKAAQGDLVLGESAAIRDVVQMVEKVAVSEDTTVLIQGESGTGKELVAGLIHQKTPGRSRQPFIEINCASLPENLLESEPLRLRERRLHRRQGAEARPFRSR